MKITTTLSMLSIACITCASFAQEHPKQDHPTPAPESIPATPLVKPKLAPKRAELPTPTPLYVGDAAPELTIDHWVKGDAIDGFEEGQVYVVEFWATWCGPCIYGMPHLSDLQDKHGDKVKIIGVSSEKDTETITSFLKKTNKSDNKVNNDRMRYTVAVDPDRTTNNVFMKAANQNGIPTAFIVDGSGKVAWIGHPSSMDEPLSEVIEGTWDLAAARESYMKEAVYENAMRELQNTYREKMKTQDWDGWIASIDSYTDEYGDNPNLTNMKFEALLTGKKDKAAAYAVAEEIAAATWDNAQGLNSLAWGIVDDTPEELQDIEFALKCATRANQLTKSQDAMIMDTLARVYWERGDVYKAIAWQTKATQNTDDAGPMADSIMATLEEYKATLANVYND